MLRETGSENRPPGRVLIVQAGGHLHRLLCHHPPSCSLCKQVAICTELRKLGATVEEGPDFCVITPPPRGGLRAGVAIDTCAALSPPSRLCPRFQHRICKLFRKQIV